MSAHPRGQDLASAPELGRVQFDMAGALSSARTCATVGYDASKVGWNACNAAARSTTGCSMENTCA